METVKFTQPLFDIALKTVEVNVHPWGFYVTEKLERTDGYDLKPVFTARRFRYTSKYDTYEKNIARVKSYYKLKDC